MRRLVVSLVAVAGLGLVATACTATPYAAVVNGAVISQSSLNSQLDAIASNHSYLASLEQSGPVLGSGKGTFATSFVAQILQEQIELVLVHQEVGARKVAITPSDVAAAKAQASQSFGSSFSSFPASYRAQLTNEFAEVAALEASIGHVSTATPALRAYYESHLAEFTSVCSSRILVPTQAKAKLVATIVQSGREPFAAAAKQFSTDSQTAGQGGQLGCAPIATYASSLGPTVATVVSGLRPGQVSAPFDTSGGWALYRVDSVSTPPFSSVVTEVRAALLSQTSTSFTTFLTKVAIHAHITVNPAYGRIEVGHAQLSLVPPAKPPAKAAPASGSAGA